MKKLFFIPLFLLFFACAENEEPSSVNEQNAQFEMFGETITADSSSAYEQLAAQLEGKDTVTIKLKSTITEVCQKKGCWMNVDLGNNQTMTVRFKDYGFFVPKDAAGKEVIFEGMAFRDTTSVETLKHYAEDAGKTKEEIDKITSPEISIAFEAGGVLIKK